MQRPSCSVPAGYVGGCYQEVPRSVWSDKAFETTYLILFSQYEYEQPKFNFKCAAVQS